LAVCDDCARHRAFANARPLAIAFASSLLGLTLAAALPLLRPSASLAALVLTVALGALVPLLFALVPRRPALAPHTSHARAAWWLGAGALACTNAGFAAELARLNGTSAEPRRLHEPRFTPWLGAGVALAIGAACVSYVVYHPRLYVLNLSDARMQVLVDEVALGWVEPSSLESARAGALLRVPAGRHRLSVRSPDIRELLAIDVDFQSGRMQLFAPLSPGVCFWLETVGYGRERREAPVYEPLLGADRFWVLPEPIDSWFAPNPDADTLSPNTSGKLLTALRQAPCADAPMLFHDSDQ
jgi:hypothetical protein